MSIASLPPDMQAFLGTLGTDLVKGWAKDLANGLLKALGKSAKAAFVTEPRQKALEEALTEALERALGALAIEPDLEEHYRDLFADFFRREMVQKELALILEPHPTAELNLTLLRREFEAAGYDADYLGVLDFDAFIARLVSAFYDAAAKRTEFHGAIEIGLLRGMMEQLQHTVENSTTTAYTPPSPPGPDDPLPEPGRLPPGSRVPYNRNALFTGREAELRALAQALLYPVSADSAAGTLLTQTLQGFGGVGKTQLAVEFIHRYGRFFHGVHWLNAQQPQLLDQEVVECGIAMGLASGQTPWPREIKKQLALTLNAWATGGPRLIVLDNLEEPAPARAWLATLRQTPCQVLIIARRAQWSPDLDLKLLPIKCFTVEENHAFLRRHFAAAGNRRTDTDGDLDALHERLGGLPLALELAARYLATRPRLGVQAYLAQLGNAFADPAMARFRAELGNPTMHDLDLAATFSLSWERIPKGPARELFLLAGFCAPNTPIPCTLLERAARLDEASCDDALDELRTLGLLDAENAIHPLLAEFARRVAPAEAKAKGSERIAALTDALARIAYEANMTGLPAAFVPLRAHVEALAPEAEHAGVENAATLWNNLGNHLQDIADLEGARAAFKRALGIWEAALGSEHPNVATAVNNLGNVLQVLGDLEGARAAHERALRIWEAALGPEHPNVATAVNNLGSVLKDLGDLVMARAAFERALRILEAVLGPEHPNVAAAVNNLGSVLQALGDLTGARAAFERALQIEQAVYGSEHPEVATDVNNLGSVLHALGNLEGARAAYERALRIDEAVYGPEHPEVATDVNNLGSVLLALGDLEGARAAYERALRIDEAVFGSDHPNVATDINNLGVVLKDLGDLEGARASYGRALGIWEHLLPSGHRYITMARRNLEIVERELAARELTEREEAKRGIRKIWDRVFRTSSRKGFVRKGKG